MDSAAALLQAESKAGLKAELVGLVEQTLARWLAHYSALPLVAQESLTQSALRSVCQGSNFELES